MGMVGKFKASGSDVFITEELGRRAPREVDYLQEKRALLDLAARMADQPAEVLPRFVELAMKIAGGVSAGLSLYEESPAPGVFRWRYLRGILATFEGATTPRNHSPCGVTLDRNAPVLSAHPERFYDWIADAGITVPEVLLVPLHIAGETPLGTLWIVSDEEGHFDSGHARAMTELAAFLGIALRMLRNEERLQHALGEQETLAKEMSHRLKNLFTVADGMIRLSARSAETKEEMAEVLSGRLQALASAHALVRRSFSDVGRTPRASDLRALIEAVVQPHEDAAGGATPRFAIEGPPFPCGDHSINGIALVFHELATNAAKYGALQRASGRVEVSWQCEDGTLRLSWVERSGPPIAAAPAARGFGSRLAEKAIVQQFAGTLDYEWRPSGLVVTITMPLESLSA